MQLVKPVDLPKSRHLLKTTRKTMHRLRELTMASKLRQAKVDFMITRKGFPGRRVMHNGVCWSGVFDYYKQASNDFLA
jgi:hypothetical protein